MEFDYIIVYCMFNFRWLFVCFLLLPCTIVYDIFVLIRNQFELVLKRIITAPNRHHVKTEFVQKQVKRWQESNQAIPMCTGRPGWKAMTLREPRYKKYMHNIHIDLGDILDIDFQRKVVKVEPLVTMGQLSAKLIPLQWTLPIFVELDDLTVGGLVMGTGIESSSHSVGLFQHICVSYELVLADGSLVHCSKDDDPDLFHSVPWSYGTLGFLTAIELQIIPSKRYVKLVYEPVYSLNEAVRVFEEHSKDKVNNTFVEGILFSKEEGVIISGQLVDCGTNVNAIGKWYKVWFYEHVYSFLKTGKCEECIPLRDYYHRHSKSLFWELKDIVPFGNHPLFRWLCGWAMPPKISFLKLTQTGIIKDLYDKHHVVQDLIVPIHNLKDSILFFDKEVNVYPVWLCPVLLPSEPGLVHSYTNKSELYVDIGLYGTPNVEDYDSIQTTKKIESFTIQAKGYQMLYAGTYCSEKEFSEMFDHSLYNRVRERLQCHNAFPNIYGKVNRIVRD